VQKNVGDVSYVPPASPPEGRLRWGYNLGCAFLNSHPNVGWPADHTCAKTGVFTCTPDGYMSANCYVKATYATEAYQSYGGFDQNAGGPQLTASASTIGIPPWMAFYTSASAAAAAANVVSAPVTAVGGYQASMDYVPVPVGYWSCMYSDASTGANASQAGDTASAVSQATGFFKAQLSSVTVGGQARCPTCRCMQTRLSAPATYAATLTLPNLGGCYRMNCYRPDYLQVAILGATAGITSSFSFWYSCPPAGGKLFVPGFLGSLTCPPAASFCAGQAVSGVLFPEQDLFSVLVFYGAIGVLCLVAFVVTCFRRARNCCLSRCEACTAVTAFEPRLDAEERERLHLKLPPPPAVPALPYAVLRFGSALTLLLGLAALVTACVATSSAVTDALTSTIAVCCVVVVFGALGFSAADLRPHRRPPCTIIVFFYGALVLSVLLLWISVYAAAFESYSSVAARYYDRLQTVFNTVAVCGADCSRARLVDVLASQLRGFAGAIIALMLLAFMQLLTSAAASALIIESRKTHALLASFVIVTSQLMLAFGVVVLVVTFYLFSNPAVAAVGGLLGVTTAAGVLFVVTASVGLAGFFSRRLDVLAGFMALQIVTGALALAACATLFAAPDLAAAALLTLDEHDLSLVVGSLGFSLAQVDIEAAVTQKLRLLALAFALVLLVMLALLPATRVLIVFMRVQWPELERQHLALRELFGLSAEDAIAERLKGGEQVAVADRHHAVVLSEITGGVAVKRVGTFVAPPRAAARVAQPRRVSQAAIEEEEQEEGYTAVEEMGSEAVEAATAAHGGAGRGAKEAPPPPPPPPP